MSTATARMRRLTIVAQDPAVRVGGRILTSQIDVPAEEPAPGPCGYRVHVIDYDSSTRRLYAPYEYSTPTGDAFRDPFRTGSGSGTDEPPSDATILGNPGFHAQNVYAIVMRTLWRFEYALGRRVSWNIAGHQLKVAPHAFADANAFYSRNEEGLLFGYFPGQGGKPVYACLSHDVVAHETTHALLDGMRSRFTDPSSPDQAAFHEGFADIVALLSVFSLRDVVRMLFDRSIASGDVAGASAPLVDRSSLTPRKLRESLLFGLAKEMGQEMSAVRGSALRQSAKLEPSRDYLKSEEFVEPHRRGEILVAAVLNALIEVLVQRFATLSVGERFLDRSRVSEEASEAADYLLTASIRALDYMPPVHMEFGDFLSALLTADREIRPDDSKYAFRKFLLSSFRAYGIRPAAQGGGSGGLWVPPEAPLSVDRVRFESMQRDPDEVFRFVWENRRELKLFEGAYTRVLSVRPCQRIAPEDGFPLRETVAECMQLLDVTAGELGRYGIGKPDSMPDDVPVRLEGGVTLIFDEYGRVKFAIGSRVCDPKNPRVQKRQSARLRHLWQYGDYKWVNGEYRPRSSRARQFSSIHRLRGLGRTRIAREGW